MKPHSTATTLIATCLSVAVLLLLPLPVSAHLVGGEAGGFVSGFEHRFNLLAML
jgi:hypothetical protein